jgi:methionyl-tRNA synthetase
LSAVQLRAALNEALRLAAEVNKYLDKTAPWFEIKQDKNQAAKSVYTALRAIDSLKILFAPFIPFSSEKLHIYLGYTQPLFGSQFTETQADKLGEHTVLRYRPGPQQPQWRPSQLQPGQALVKPEPLFRKLEPTVAAEERARLG